MVSIHRFGKIGADMTVAEIVKHSAKTNFSFYRDSNLWYKTDNGYEFPVPISDIGSATFLAQDKTILFMRYIRKHVEMVENAKTNLST